VSGKLKLVVLQVSSYTTLGSFNAEHWYGKLHCSDESGRKSHELKRKLTDKKEIAYLNEKDDTGKTFAWSVGDETNRFKSREDVEREAVRQWEKVFPAYGALVVGNTASADPQRPLDARKPAVLKILKCFWKHAQATGGYGKNYKAMDEIHKEYWAWVCGKSTVSVKGGI
jgi:hypothetical protein